VIYALFTAAPSLIFNENESEAVRDRSASLQWAVLLFNVFSDCSAYKTLEKISFQEISVDKNSRQCKLWKIIQLFTADAIGNTVYPSQPHFHTCHGAALNKVC